MVSPSPSCTIRSCGEEALGGLSLKTEVSPPDTEWEGVAASPTLGLLKTRLIQVSSSSESTTTATTPFCLSTGAGSVVLGAEVAEVGGVIGIEVLTPAAVALRLASSSASFFFLSLLKPISAQRRRISQGTQVTIIKQVRVQAKIRQE